EALGPWLYGVAYRTAIKARAGTARRREREQPVTVEPVTGPADDLVWRDLRPVLDDALSRLPTKYREPVVLCYLHGRTNAQAARQLGVPVGTVATRLARAREQLRRYLTRRGLALSAPLLGTVLAEHAAAGMVPAVLSAATARTALAFAAGGAAAVSVQVAALMKGVCQAMLIAKLKILAAVLLTIGAAGTTTGVT